MGAYECQCRDRDEKSSVSHVGQRLKISSSEEARHSQWTVRTRERIGRGEGRQGRSTGGGARVHMGGPCRLRFPCMACPEPRLGRSSLARPVRGTSSMSPDRRGRGACTGGSARQRYELASAQADGAGRNRLSGRVTGPARVLTKRPRFRTVST